MMRGLTRRPAFWVAYATLAALAALVAWRLFPLAIPIVNLEITASRDDALVRARALAAQHALAPAEARAAIEFAHDGATQNYVELEGGGKPAFAALVAGGLYAPYTWDVRLFVPGAIGEARLRLRPDGSADGFAQRLPETWLPPEPAGRALAPAAARALAERAARDDWGVDVAAYAPLEATSETRTTGRVDHAFVYERPERLGEARIRLRLGVTGDRLTEIVPFVHLPESFERRFRELRSANDTIAAVASLSAGLLYGLGGCILGVVWLLRARLLLWRPALAAGLVVGALMGAASLANLPAAWLGYDTAQSVPTFLLRQLGAAALVVVGGGLGYALVFMAAESLARRAFPDHPQLWRVYSSAAAPTRAVVGRTLGGYLFVPVELALIAAFYYASNRWLGWWQPSEALTDPNVLASAVPALSPIALSLQAGAMEESLFRAVPLALAAIVGTRFGVRRGAIGVAVVVQALIFGGAHANYPGLPAYSRLVELIVPSILWALIFLRFGLVPTVLLHALFDLALFSIPVFLVDAPGAGLQRALIVAAALLPLAYVLLCRLRAGGWSDLPAALTNGGWQRPAAAVAPVAAAAGATTLPRRVAAFQRALPWLGAAGFGAWLAATPWTADVPPLAVDRATAIAAADRALAARGITLGSEWQRLAVVRLAADDARQWQGHKFVWTEAGPAAYRALVGSVLAPPLWDVRYARFDGDVVDRAEEWRVTVTGDGTLRQVRHALPEGRPGARLDAVAAQAIATRALVARFGAPAAAWPQGGADERALPARTDWSFTYVDPAAVVGAGGEARAVVALAGDEIAGIGRYVEVPEAWQRAERERDARDGVLRMALGAAFALAALGALIFGILRWTRGQCDRRAFAAVAAIEFLLTAATFGNGWPQLVAGLATTDPVATQVGLAAFAALAGGLLVALLAGLLAGVGAAAARAQARAALAGRWPPWALGVAAALLAAGAGAAGARLVPAGVPLWPSPAAAATAWPALAALLQGAGTLATIATAIFVLVVVERVTGGWQRRASLAVVALVAAAALSVVVGAPQPLAAAVAGLAAGLVVVGVVYGLLRYDYRAVPAFVATGAVLGFAEHAALAGTPDAWGRAGLAALVAAALAWAVMRYLAAPRAAAR